MLYLAASSNSAGVRRTKVSLLSSQHACSACGGCALLLVLKGDRAIVQLYNLLCRLGSDVNIHVVLVAQVSSCFSGASSFGSSAGHPSHRSFSARPDDGQSLFLTDVLTTDSLSGSAAEPIGQNETNAGTSERNRQQTCPVESALPLRRRYMYSFLLQEPMRLLPQKLHSPTRWRQVPRVAEGRRASPAPRSRLIPRRR